MPKLGNTESLFSPCSYELQPIYKLRFLRLHFRPGYRTHVPTQIDSYVVVYHIVMATCYYVSLDVLMYGSLTLGFLLYKMKKIMYLL